MKKRTKIILTSALTVTGLLVAAGGYWAYKTFVPQETPVDKNATVSSNYYQAINKKWLEKAEIPSDQPANSVVYELGEEVKERLKGDVKNLASEKEKSSIEGMDDFISYYQQGSDFKQREKDGLDPLKPYLKEIEDLKDLDDLAAKAADWQRRGLSLPFGFDISVNVENTNQKQIHLSTPSTFLPDTSYYQDENAKKSMMQPVEQAAQKALQLLGYSEKDSQRIVKEALDIDAEIAKYALSSEEASEIKKQVHPKTVEEINSYSDTFKFSEIIHAYLGQEVDQVNIPNPKYYENFAKVVNDKNFAKLKSWMLVRQAGAASNLLTDQYRLVYAEINKAWQGTKEASSKEDDVYSQTTTVFADSLSLYYGQKYFGQEAKEKVAQMVDSIKTVYRERLLKNDWLSEETKQEAVKKLDSMILRIGYPDKIQEETKVLKTDSQKNFFENTIAMSTAKNQYAIDHFSEPVDKTQWSMPSFDINAYYSQIDNSINFPAGILQAPFFDAEQDMEKNYGGIGMVIGHEMTHAFDSNGAEFDEEGNMKNWWTKADKKAFEEKTAAVAKQWDGLEIYGGKVNGKLTVTENVADAGGLSATLEVVKKENPKADLKLYFENYANIWRNKSSLQFNQMLLKIDVHAPAELRVNQQLKNIQAFYDTYPEIKKGDAMYLDPDKRVSVW
ncbi:M13-type metalloendopeptidase [Streptococcus panodentis]|uniref:Peptidase M13 n=1 Tax=Streptococcus panodentis TaxID=1581472 RepID=A0ABS5AXT1_9STRE|nr:MULTISPECIES: M13 family metallopeptidase [Streptococcus]KXT82225.1 hypothetical protein STRDD11_01910 [Streptococcus sp. DD11]MBP2621246.1 peptidase M13 [Streptococcus panodentis]